MRVKNIVKLVRVALGSVESGVYHPLTRMKDDGERTHFRRV